MVKKILLVDDDEAVLKLLTRSLSSAGYKVITCSEGNEALNIAKHEHPNLIIMDIVLNGLDGAESATRLKQNESTKDIPVIFLTGLRTKNEAEHDKYIGGYVVLGKPFDNQQLLTQIDSLLKKT